MRSVRAIGVRFIASVISGRMEQRVLNGRRHPSHSTPSKFKACAVWCQGSKTAATARKPFDGRREDLPPGWGPEHRIALRRAAAWGLGPGVSGHGGMPYFPWGMTEPGIGWCRAETRSGRKRRRGPRRPASSTGPNRTWAGSRTSTPERLYLTLELTRRACANAPPFSFARRHASFQQEFQTDGTLM